MLDETEQAEMVWASSNIGQRLDDEHTILLYQVDSFYVEVYYHREKNMVSKMRSFSNPDQLEPYTMHINILQLLTGNS
jgi:hypothetical protein